MPWERVSAIDSMRRNVTGSNTGNMIFQQAVIKALSVPGQEVARATNKSPHPDQADRINEQGGMLVLPLSNWFRPNFAARLDRAAEMVRRVKGPVVVVGVGCQADLDYDVDALASIAEPARRFVSAVLDKSASIGVRGECTAAFLHKLGFRDVEVIGCPSMFMDGPSFPELSTVSRFDRGTKLSVNISPEHHQAAFSSGTGKVGRIIAAAVRDHDDVEYVPQENGSIHGLLFARSSATPEHGDIPEHAYRQMHGRGAVVAFVDPRTWSEHLGKRDFVFGTRLHGCIAGLLGGTPAHLVAHDSRTLELARYFQIPHTTTRDLDPDESAASIHDRSDFTAMFSGHRERFDRYAAFLARNGLRDVFTDDGGGGGGAFDRRLAAARLAPPVRPASPGRPDVLMRRAGAAIRRALGGRPER